MRLGPGVGQQVLAVASPRGGVKMTSGVDQEGPGYSSVGGEQEPIWSNQTGDETIGVRREEGHKPVGEWSDNAVNSKERKGPHADLVDTGETDFGAGAAQG